MDSGSSFYFLLGTFCFYLLLGNSMPTYVINFIKIMYSFSKKKIVFAGTKIVKFYRFYTSLTRSLRYECYK